MAFKLTVDEKIFDDFPDYRGTIIYASGLTNTPSTDQTRALLREVESGQQQNFEFDAPRKHPHVAAWRNAFSRFGAKPQKYPCSVEALLKRVLSGKELPAINALVDIYNAVSVRHVLPVGGEDRDRLASDLVLRFMSGTEEFVTFRDGQSQVENPPAGEIAWCDDAGITCRRWNWRQGRRTALTVESTSAYFVLDRLAPYPEEAMIAAAEELETRIRGLCPAVTLSREVLGC